MVDILGNGLNPDQPRVPAGSSKGGQFGKGSGAGAGSIEEWKGSLNEKEQYAFRVYTNGYAYASIRDCQNKGEGCNKKVKEIITNLDKSLKRAPKHEGQVYRGLSFNTDEARADFIARVQREGTLTDKGFMSTSRDKKVAEKFAKGGSSKNKQVILEIKSKSGVDISSLSSIDEKEVLMSPKSKLKYVGMSKGAKDQIHVILEEQ